MVALLYRGRGILKLASELSTSWTLALQVPPFTPSHASAGGKRGQEYYI